MHPQYPIRSAFIVIATLGALFAAASPAPAQDAEPIIARAQQTLEEIESLIDGIQARNSQSAIRNSQSAEGWKNLFDGNSLADWKRTEFAGGGEVHVEKAFRGGPPAIVVDAGSTLSGFNFTNEAPKTNYEIAVEWMKVDGSDFGCGLTFPVGDSFASLILGGWGGGVVGISSIDHQDASENETTKYIPFSKDRWFRVRLRVTPAKLEAWLDDKEIVSVQISGRRIDLRPGEIYKSKPLGIATYQTSAAFRSIKLRRLDRE